MEPTYYTMIDTPVGDILLAGSGTGLAEIRFRNGTESCQPDPGWKESRVPFREAIRQLRAYFAGELRDFDLAIAPVGTAFQKKVWRALRGIPYGKTVSYGELARRIGSPTASRAVGAANGRNPLPIVVPCHRVIGSDGALTGYAGGLDVKEKLLAIEGVR